MAYSGIIFFANMWGGVVGIVFMYILRKTPPLKKGVPEQIPEPLPGKFADLIFFGLVCWSHS